MGYILDEKRNRGDAEGFGLRVAGLVAVLDALALLVSCKVARTARNSK